jgi:hypothetical protein
MTDAVCSVSPVMYLHRIGALEWLPKLFTRVIMPSVVLEDLLEGRFIGYNVPSPFDLPWIQYEDPQLTIPSAWISLDLSSGEVAAMSVAFENRDCLVLLDDPMARKAAHAVGLKCWGTLRIMLEAKKAGLTESITPFVDRLGNAGIWIPEETRLRIQKLANESDPEPGEPNYDFRLKNLLAANQTPVELLPLAGEITEKAAPPASSKVDTGGLRTGRAPAPADAAQAEATIPQAPPAAPASADQTVPRIPPASAPSEEN